ncbi:MAG: NADH-ubiquinone oxidoreductase-F iron-sulfur binding region domain-containing protein [Actinomycetota bacterium]
MDLHLTDDRPTEVERSAVDALLAGRRAVIHEDARVVRGGRSRAKQLRHLVLPCLHMLQEAAGWISPGGLNHVAERLSVPPAELYGVATFYDLLSVEPQPETLVRVCDDVGCRIHDAVVLDGALVDAGFGGEARIGSPCLGQCDHGAAAVVQQVGLPLRSITAAVGPAPVVASTLDDGLLGRIGVVDPSGWDDHLAHGGHAVVREVLERGSDWVLDELDASGLSGRGGAAFPTAVKWRAVAGHGGECHVVANADESEPGTFKDRVLMEGDPFRLIEAMTVAGLTVGAERGWIYLRGEYPVARARIEQAIAATRAAGWLGDDLGGLGRRFELELRLGAGAYICGEETALFNSIEGYRGEPRNKPPFPTDVGLFGRPTVVNNVETLHDVLLVLRGGAAAFAATGAARSTGPRLFCLSGNVERPGVYEHAYGVTLGEVIASAGGVSEGRELQAVLLGGAAGVLVGPESLDLVLTLDDARAAGATLGSGVVMVFDDRVDLADVVRRNAAFFQHESCGQCVPCRVGTQRQVELLDRGAIDRDLAADLDAVMTDASICGLGQTAASVTRSAIALGVFDR